MPIYVYETMEGRPVKRFEVKQSMRDEPLRVDPDTGRRVKRVITGGYGYMEKSGGAAPRAATGGARGGGCGSGGCGCC